MREKDIERKFVAEVKRRGGICPKWVSPGFDGMPDRIALLPGGKSGFVEAKAPGRSPVPPGFPLRIITAAGVPGVCPGRPGADWRTSKPTRRSA